MSTAFIHVPKTGGSSLYNEKIKICSHSIGHGKFSDYQDRGHDHKYMTIIRDPYQTSISYYYSIKPGMGIEDFLYYEEKKMYSYYFENMSIDDFYFIGNLQEMKKTFSLLNKMFDTDVPYRHVNKNLNLKNNVQYDIKKFIKNNQKEYELYFSALEKYKKLSSYHL